ncbi:IS110 family transposase [Micromonospora rifamycinica]|uniref:IS110 family transposase n=1 Tax=Micromonospora rifamycinica TaxID=291594 RepID=UPI002E29A24E|nr:transposase [Micromonospora rifamycinica]
MTVYCGIDWAEEHHDVAIVNDSGGLVARLRIGDDAAGYRQLIDLLADAGDNPQQPIPVTIETSRGLLVACLRATGRQIYAINPVAVARHRDRYTVSRTKSDHVDAMVLANTAALRHLSNRLLGCLHHCLQTQQLYQETTAFTPPQPQQLPTAA